MSPRNPRATTAFAKRCKFCRPIARRGRQAPRSLISTIFQPQDSTVADTTTQLAAGQPPAAQPGARRLPPGNPLPPQRPPRARKFQPVRQTAIDAARLAEAAGGLLGPVQVEFVEGLDVIVLRGSERDVQRVMEIIKQIEDLSAVTVPDIQIYELKYVDSVQMGALLQRLYEQVLGPRIGTVSITPLGKPNALLAHRPAGKREDGDRADRAAGSAGRADVAIRSLSAEARLGH